MPALRFHFLSRRRRRKNGRTTLLGAISLSASQGMPDSDEGKETRRERDAALAKKLKTSQSMLSFCKEWYEQPMWKSLVSRDGMSIEEVAKKLETPVGEGRKGEIANVLEHSSVGKQEHVGRVAKETRKMFE